MSRRIRKQLIEPVEPTLRVLFLGIDHQIAAGLATLTSERSPHGVIVPVTKTTEVVHTLQCEAYDCVVVGGALGHAGGMELIKSSLSGGSLEAPPIIVIGDESATSEEAYAAGAADWIDRTAVTSALLARSIGFAVASRESRQRLSALSLIDDVTGLASETLFWHLLEHSFQRAKRNKDQIAVFATYLSGIGTINDSLGWAAGDDALRTCALRLRGTLRASDLIARLHGAKFAVLIEAVNDIAELNTVARKIEETVEPSFEVDGQPVHLNPISGVAVYPMAAESPIALVRQAVDSMDAAIDAATVLRFA